MIRRSLLLLSALIAASPSLWSQINDINPNTATAGSGSLTMNIDGEFAVGVNTTVYWDSSTTSQLTQLSILQLTGAQIQVTVPASLLAAPDTAFVYVVQGSSVSNQVTFTVTQAAPTLTLLTPNVAVAGSPDLTLTVNGTNFPQPLPSSSTPVQVTWAGRNLTTSFVSTTQLTATVPAVLLATPGSVNVSLNTNPPPTPLVFTIVSPVTLTSLTPNAIQAGSPTFSMIVNGTSFQPNSTVTWNGASLQTTFNNSTQLTASVPASLVANTGSASVTVATPGLNTPAALTFTIGQTLTLTSLSPSSTAAGGPSFTLTVNGSGFNANTTIFWNSQQLTATPVNAGQITATVPANLIAQPGTAAVKAQNGNVSSNSLTFTVTNPGLTLTSLSPNSAFSGGPAFTLTVNGSGFTPNTQVTWNGTGLATSFVSANQLTATVTANLIAAAGTAAVTVVSSINTSPAPLTFTIVQSLSLTSLSPSSAAAGGPAFNMVVNGTGLGGNTIISWNGTSLATVSSSQTQMTVSVPANLIAQPGNASITAQNSGQTSNSLTFTVTAAITLTSLNPSNAIAGSPAFTLTVNGTGFQSGAFVTWNGSPLSTMFVNSTQLTASVPANLIATPGSELVGVSVPGLVSPQPLVFTVNSNFTLTSLSPNTIAPGSPSFVLTVSGTGFATGTVVFWNTTALPTTVSNATTMTANVPDTLVAQAGLASITAHNGNQVTNALTFAVTSQPLTLTSLSPSSAPAGSPDLTLTVNGSGFLAPSIISTAQIPGTTVTWNGASLTTTYVSSTQLTAIVPAALLATPGSASVSVTGQPTPSSLPFGITAGLTLTSLSPPATTSGGPQFNLTVNGTGFTSSTLVTWNGSVLSTTFISSTQLNAIVPAALIAQPGSASVSVSAIGTQPPAPLLFSIMQGVSLTSLSPTVAIAGGPAFTLTANGIGFTQGSFINWNGTALPTTFVSPNQLNAPVTAALIAQAATVPVNVNSSGVVSNTLPFTIQLPSPSILSLTPSSGQVGGPAFTLTILGTNFLNTSVVTWNAITLNTTFVSPTQINGNIPAILLSAPGIANIVVTNGSLASNAVQFAVNLPPPVITSISPATAPAGSPSVVLTVNGSGFVSGATVSFNSTSLATTFVSSTQVTAVIPASLLVQPGTAQISASNTSGGPSNSVPFIISQPPPVITSLSPSTANVGGPAFSLTVSGTGFLSGATVMWNATALNTSFISATQVSAAVTADLIAQAGVIQITVTNPGSLPSNALPFTVGIPTPTLTSLTPNMVPAGTPGLLLTVSGTNFLSGATVSFNTTPLSTTVVSTTQVTANIPANLIAQAGTAQITAANTGGAASNALTLTIVPGPMITSIAPATVPPGGPAFTLTVNGSNFVSASTVSLGTSQLVTTFVSSTQLTAAVPANLVQSPVTLPVVVTNPGGVVSNPMPLTVASPTPTITSISPSSVVAGGPALTITIVGTNFLTGAGVLANNTPVSTTVVSSTQVTAQIPPNLTAQPGTIQITVANSGGTPSVAVTLTVTPPPPTLTSITPISARVGDPTFTLALTGANFVQASVVQWNGAPLSTTFLSSTQLTATIDAGRLILPATASVTVVNPPGPDGNPLVSNALTFTINPVVPSITSLSPNSVTAGSAAFSITVTGTGLINLSSILWNTTPLTTHFVSATQVTADVPASLVANVGTASITAVNPGNNVSNAVSFSINLPPPPSLRLSAPTGVGPAQQPTIDFGLNSNYPLPITATVTLTFVSNATVPVDDPAIQFASGGRTMTFTVPANTTTFPAVQISSGTVAGTITIAVTLTAAGANVTPPNASTTIVIPKSAPVLVAGKVKLVHANGYIEVDVTGYSTTRDMTSATFHLNAAPGASFIATDITVPMSASFTTWYQSAVSGQFGSQFSYAQPFTVVGDTNQIQSVTVTLTNSAGASVSMTTN